MELRERERAKMTLVLPTKLRRGPCLIEMEWILPEIWFLTLYHHPTKNTKTSSLHIVCTKYLEQFWVKKPYGYILAKNLVLDEHFVLSFLLTTIILFVLHFNKPNLTYTQNPGFRYYTYPPLMSKEKQQKPGLL